MKKYFYTMVPEDRAAGELEFSVIAGSRKQAKEKIDDYIAKHTEELVPAEQVVHLGTSEFYYLANHRGKHIIPDIEITD